MKRVDWSITQACNFNCDYCHTTDETPKGLLPVDNLLSSLEGSGEEWVIHLSGGEPIIHPDFLQSCQKITQKHLLSVNTNLSKKSVVESFVKMIDPARVTEIDISLHIEERERKTNGIVNFIECFHILKEAGFSTVVNYVYHPRLSERVESDIKYFQERGIDIHPKRFKGIYQNKTYPFAYTVGEKELLHKHYDRSENRMDYDFQGLPCRAGMNLIKLKADGEVYRCPGDNTEVGRLGNINKSSIKLYNKPKACQVTNCPCWGVENIVLNDSQKYFLDGINQYALGKLTESRDSFLESLGLNSKYSHALNNLAVLDFDDGFFNDAFDKLKEAFKLNPHSKMIFKNLLTFSTYLKKEYEKEFLLSLITVNSPEELKVIRDDIYTKKFKFTGVEMTNQVVERNDLVINEKKLALKEKILSGAQKSKLFKKVLAVVLDSPIGEKALNLWRKI